MSHYMTCPLCGYQATESNSREVGIVVKMLEHRTREHVRYTPILRGACGHGRGSHYGKQCSYCACGGFLLGVFIADEGVPA